MKISDFQTKDVINIQDGKHLGHVHDLELDVERGRVLSIIIPGPGRFFGMFNSSKELVIPWRSIVRIGVDCILVNLESAAYTPPSLPSHSPSSPSPHA